MHRECFQCPRYVTLRYFMRTDEPRNTSFVAGKITSHFLHKQTDVGASLSTDPRLKTSKVFFFLNNVVFEAVT